MGQFLTILIDALRLLRSQALFHIALVISALMAFVLLCIGFDEKGVSICFGLTHIETGLLREGSPWNPAFYLGLFQMFGVGLWLSWGAIILGLISTASLFPSYQKSTRVGIELAKPIGRWKLFLSRYLGGLAFIVLQLVAFCGVAWLAVGWRLGLWLGEIWLAVPVVTLSFSYLYAVLVLVGTWTRSTLAGLIAALILWMATALTGFAEASLYSIVELDTQRKAAEEAQASQWEAEIEEWESRNETVVPPPEQGVFAGAGESLESASDGNVDDDLLGGEVDSSAALDPTPWPQDASAETRDLGGPDEFARMLKRFHGFALAFYTVLPKTKPTTTLVGRSLGEHTAVDGVQYPLNSSTVFSLLGGMAPVPELGAYQQAQEQRHSPAWIIGTSLAFEVAVVALAGWIFLRRDF